MKRRRRRRNPSGGVVGWATAHPFLTFMLLSSALSLPVSLVYALRREPDRPRLPPAEGDPWAG